MPRAQLVALLAIAVFVVLYLVAGAELHHAASGFLAQLQPAAS